ncbi:MAG: C39 family peptidase [Clostridia bacterium]|nr:C39 family peptidase [Clostridia bacterium]
MNHTQKTTNGKCFDYDKRKIVKKRHKKTRRGIDSVYFFYLCVLIFLMAMIIYLVISCKQAESEAKGYISERDTTTSSSNEKNKRRICLDVDNIMQKPHLPNGCEVVSLAIVLNYEGYSVDSLTLYEEHMPKSPYKKGDPWTSYVGDAKNIGLGCYAPGVVITGNSYLKTIGSLKEVYDVSCRSFSYYKNLIDEGIPVIMWATIDMNRNSSVCWSAVLNEKQVKWHTYSHCLVLIGYTDDSYIFCDPLVGVAEYDKIDVEESFKINFEQACIIR